MREDNPSLPFWQGFRVSDLRVGANRVDIDLEPDPTEPLRCGGCAQACAQVHEHVRRQVRDLPMLGLATRLNVHLRRVACPRCGRRVQKVAWLQPHSRLTRRLAEAVGRLTAQMATLHVARLFGLHWSTVRACERQALGERLSSLPPVRPTRLIMDEFALFKGHRYATVVLDADSGRVLWVGVGRGRREVRPFFQQLGPQGCSRIQAVAMDMNTAFDLEVKAHCPNARVVYDLFHVIAKYGREVISRVRVDAANQLRHDRPARRVVKQAHWLLLRNPANLRQPEQVRLDEVLQANQSLLAVYLMKAQLHGLWNAPDPWEWRRRWRAWHSMAADSGIAALIRFANALRRYWRGILARVRWPMHTGKLEGINNRIKVIKRMAFGYRDTEFFFMKIRAAFPGKP
jgi:transposase